MVDDAQRHRLLAVQHGAHIVGHISGSQHQLAETVLADVAVGRHKLHDALPYPLEVAVCLRRGDDRTGHAHGVDGHGCGVGNKRLLSAHRQRHADGVTAAQYQRHRGQAHPRHQLRDGKTCLDVAAYRVQKQHQSVHLVRLLQ